MMPGQFLHSFRDQLLLALLAFLITFRCVKAENACQNLLQLHGIEFRVDWWDVQPYSYVDDEKQSNYSIEGIFPKLMRILQNRTGVQIKHNAPFSSYSNFSKTALKSSNYSNIVYPVMEAKDYDDDCYIPIVNTNGPAYFIHIKKIVPLTLLGKGLLQGWQVIALTVVLAAISGVFIWLVDRKTNPEDFPAAFFPGIWQGFWWAFVTMTTVGYGDTAPRSVLARLYSILWMIIGMIAFSVLTANITSSLTRQSFDAEEKLFGNKVGVLEDTMDAEAALMENANVNNYNSMTKLLSDMKSERVDGILIERYIAGAYYNKYIREGLELGTLINYPYSIGMRVPNYIPGKDLNPEGACKVFKKCLLGIKKDHHIVREILTDLSKGWQEFKKSESSSLFEEESFFYILIAFFVALCVAGGLWHYFVFIPSTRKKENQVECAEDGNADGNTAVGEEHVKHSILLQQEVDELMCAECRDKIIQIQKDNPDRESNHHSAFPFSLPLGHVHLKQISTNALGQLRNLPGDTLGHIPGLGRAQRKRGRIM